MDSSLEDHGIPSAFQLWWLQVHRGGHSPGLVVQLWRLQSLHRGVDWGAGEMTQHRKTLDFCFPKRSCELHDATPVFLIFFHHQCFFFNHFSWVWTATSDCWIYIHILIRHRYTMIYINRSYIQINIPLSNEFTSRYMDPTNGINTISVTLW